MKLQEIQTRRNAEMFIGFCLQGQEAVRLSLVAVAQPVAAMARSHGAVLVTGNRRRYDRISDLEIENRIHD